LIEIKAVKVDLEYDDILEKLKSFSNPKAVGNMAGMELRWRMLMVCLLQT